MAPKSSKVGRAIFCLLLIVLVTVLAAGGKLSATKATELDIQPDQRASIPVQNAISSEGYGVGETVGSRDHQCKNQFEQQC